MRPKGYKHQVDRVYTQSGCLEKVAIISRNHGHLYFQLSVSDLQSAGCSLMKVLPNHRLILQRCKNVIFCSETLPEVPYMAIDKALRRQFAAITYGRS